MTDQGQGNESSKENFTERAVMALVMEAAETKETTLRLCAIIAALAMTHGVSTEV